MLCEWAGTFFAFCGITAPKKFAKLHGHESSKSQFLHLLLSQCLEIIGRGCEKRGMRPKGRFFVEKMIGQPQTNLKEAEIAPHGAMDNPVPPVLWSAHSQLDDSGVGRTEGDQTPAQTRLGPRGGSCADGMLDFSDPRTGAQP